MTIRTDSIVLGRKIGTDSGWDECGDYESTRS